MNGDEKTARAKGVNGAKRKAEGNSRNWQRASDAELVTACESAGLATVGKSRDELVRALARTPR